MALPIQNVAGLLRFPGESAGGVTIGAQNIGGQLIILLPNTDPVVDQVLAVDSVSGTSVITKWATPESSGPESNETWLEEFGGGVSVNAGPTIPTGQQTQAATLKAALEAAMAPMQAARKAYTDFLKTAAGATTPARLQLSDDGKSIIVG